MRPLSMFKLESKSVSFFDKFFDFCSSLWLSCASLAVLIFALVLVTSSLTSSMTSLLHNDPVLSDKSGGVWTPLSDESSPLSDLRESSSDFSFSGVVDPLVVFAS